MGKKTLTPKQELFISEYLIDWNASRAAREAGYSERTAKEQGSQNLIKPEIAKEINKRLRKELKDNEAEKVRLIREYKKMAYVDLEAELEKETPTMKAPDKLKAMEGYGKHLKLFTDVIEHTTIDDEGNRTGINFE